MPRLDIMTPGPRALISLLGGVVAAVVAGVLDNAFGDGSGSSTARQALIFGVFMTVVLFGVLTYRASQRR